MDINHHARPDTKITVHGHDNLAYLRITDNTTSNLYMFIRTLSQADQLLAAVQELHDTVRTLNTIRRDNATIAARGALPQGFTLEERACVIDAAKAAAFGGDDVDETIRQTILDVHATRELEMSGAELVAEHRTTHELIDADFHAEIGYVIRCACGEQFTDADEAVAIDQCDRHIAAALAAPVCTANAHTTSTA